MRVGSEDSTLSQYGSRDPRAHGHVRCTRACNTCARLHRPVILSSAPLTLSLSKHLQPVHRMCDTIPDCTFIMPHIQFAVACACALDRCSIPQKLPVSRLDLCEEGLVPEPFGLHGRRSHLLARRGSTAAWPPSASPAPRALAVRSCHRVFWRNAGLPAAMTLIRASLGIGRVVTSCGAAHVAVRSPAPQFARLGWPAG